MKSLSCHGRPVLIDSLRDFAIMDVSCGYFHTAVLTGTQDVLTFGWNHYRQCGIDSGESDIVALPYRMDSLRHLSVHKLAMGSLHSIALTERGIVFAWGDSYFGQIERKERRKGMEGNEIPQSISTLLKMDVTQIVCGDFHSLAIAKERGESSSSSSNRSRVFAWGRNGATGRLGVGTTERVVLEAEEVRFEGLEEGEEVTQISAGDFHSAALTSLGRVFSWGSGESGALGHGTDEFNELIPRLVEYFTEKRIRVRQICCGGGHTLALTEGGVVYGWGCNISHRLGVEGDTSNRLIPTPITRELTGKRITEISAGLWHSACRTEDEEVYLWGRLMDPPKRRVSPKMVFP